MSALIGVFIFTLVVTGLVWLAGSRTQAPPTYAAAVRLVLKFVGICALPWMMAAPLFARLAP